MSYIAEVAGKYYITDQNGRATYKPYQLKFRLNSAEKPLSDIVRFLLADALKKRYPESEGYLTHNLIGIYDEQDPESVADIPVLFMSRDQLKQYCKLRKLSYVDIPDNLAIDVLRVEVQIASEKGEKDYKEVTKLRRERSMEADRVRAGAQLIEEDEEIPSPKRQISSNEDTVSGVGESLPDDPEPTPQSAPDTPKKRRTRKKARKKQETKKDPIEDFEL